VFVGGQSTAVSSSGGHLASVYYGKPRNVDKTVVADIPGSINANTGVEQWGSGVRRGLTMGWGLFR
jgi:hypothetical protein